MSTLVPYSSTNSHWKRDDQNWNSSVTVIQGRHTMDGRNTIFRGGMVFNFAAIRLKNATDYIVSATLHITTSDPGYPQGDAEVQLYSASSPATLSGGIDPVKKNGPGPNSCKVASGIYKPITLPLNAALINDLVDPATTFLYIDNSSGAADSNYVECCGWNNSTVAHRPRLDITWETRNTAPEPPASIDIDTTGLHENNGNWGAMSSVTVSCAASPSSDVSAYQFESSVNSGPWVLLQQWSASQTATMNLTAFGESLPIVFRVMAKDNGGLTSAYVTTSNYAYKIAMPTAPYPFIVPTIITPSACSLSWTAPETYDHSLDLRYNIEINDGLGSWRKITDGTVDNGKALCSMGLAGTSCTINPYTAFCLNEAAQQYLYRTDCSLRIQAYMAQSVQGVLLYGPWQTASTVVDLRIPVSVSSVSASSSSPCEGGTIKLSIAKGSPGNTLDAKGLAMTYVYEVDFVYGESIFMLAKTSPAVWGDQGDLVEINGVTVPALADSGDITGTLLCMVMAQESGAMPSSKTGDIVNIMRCRQPVARITDIARSKSGCILSYSIADTGVDPAAIDGITSITSAYVAIAPTTPASLPLTAVCAADRLINQVPLVLASDGTSKGVATVTITNKTGKSFILTQDIPQYMPNMKLSDDGLYVKGGYIVWDSAGLAQTKLASDTSGLFHVEGWNGTTWTDIAQMSQSSGVAFQTPVTIDGGGAGLTLKPNAFTDDMHVDFHARSGASVGTIGYNTPTVNDFIVKNINANGNVNLIPGSGGSVQANGNIVWHSGNDGMGLGLNADLLQGHDATHFKADLVSTPNKVLGRISSGSGQIEEIPLSGVSDVVITGAAGIAGNLAMWNINGDVVDSGMKLSGWISAGEIWTYASATSINVPSGAASKYRIGDKIRLVHTYLGTSTTRYFYVVGVSETLLSITGGSDYTIVNDCTISDNCYSHDETPVGHPLWFSWAPSITGFSLNPPGGIYSFAIYGVMCVSHVRQPNAGTSGGTNGTAFTITAPISAKTLTGGLWRCEAAVVDNGTSLSTPGAADISSGSSSIILYKTTAGGSASWTSSGSKRAVGFTLSYLIA